MAPDTESSAQYKCEGLPALLALFPVYVLVLGVAALLFHCIKVESRVNFSVKETLFVLFTVTSLALSL